MPTWVARAKSPEGEFLRAAGIHKHWVTSSGYMNCVSASGKFLGGRPSQQVLDAFAKLPESERRPGAVKVPELAEADRVLPAPPPGGLVLRVHARFLARDGSRLRYARGADFPLMADKPGTLKTWQLFLHPNTEYLWLTRAEAEALVPTDPKVGQTLPVPAAVAQRMARFHMYPQRSMTSEGFGLSKKAVRQAELKLTVDKATPEKVHLRLTGHIHTGSDFDAQKATVPNGPLAYGFETQLYGLVEIDRAKGTITRFDVAAPGEVWGRWGDANGKSLPVERPGRSPFGFAFELAPGTTPSDRIPPGGNGAMVLGKTGYFGS